MKCSRCSAELPASATYCFQCGQSFQSLSHNASSYAQSDTFSYLPVGTPPWPTNIPTAASINGTPSFSTTDTRAENRPKRSVGGFIAMVAVALLVPILGAGLTFGTLFMRGQLGSNTAQNVSTNKVAVSTPQLQPTQQTSTTTNQLPAPSSSKKFSDTDLNVLLQYPDNWDPDQIRKTTSTTSLDIHPHQSPLNMIFYVIHLTDTVSNQFQTASDVNTAQIQSLSQQQGISSLQMVQSSNTQPTIGGSAWTAQEATFQVASGDTYHLTVISTQHGKAYYTVLFWIPETYYSEAMNKYIQPMIQSLQFIK